MMTNRGYYAHLMRCDVCIHIYTYNIYIYIYLFTNLHLYIYIRYTNIYIYIYIYTHTHFNQHSMIEGSLEVKLPTIWTDGQAEVGRVREEKPRSEKIRKEKE